MKRAATGHPGARRDRARDRRQPRVLASQSRRAAGYTSWCNINGEVNCDVVLSSEYADFLGMPVALLGDPRPTSPSALAGVVALRIASASRRRQLAGAALRRGGVERAVLALPGVSSRSSCCTPSVCSAPACTSSTSVCWSPPPSSSPRCARRRAAQDAWQGAHAPHRGGRRCGGPGARQRRRLEGRAAANQMLTAEEIKAQGSRVLRLVHEAADRDRLARPAATAKGRPTRW